MSSFQFVAGASSRDLISAERELAQLNHELAQELALAAIDLAGIVDPTPISDAIGLSISLARGDLLGAGLSLISIIPYAGDALGKSLKGSRAAKKIAKLRERILAIEQKIHHLRRLPGGSGARAERTLELGKRAPKAVPTSCVECRKRLLESVRRQEAEVQKLLRSPEHLRAREDAFRKYRRRGGTWNRARWEANYDTLTRNREIGRFAEESFQKEFGGYSMRLKVRVGGIPKTRVVDNVYGNVAREVKSGYVRLDNFIKDEIKKDLQLIKMKGMKVEWHLMQGADPKVVNALQKAGIKILWY